MEDIPAWMTQMRHKLAQLRDSCALILVLLSSLPMEVEQMQSPTFPSLQQSSKSFTNPGSDRAPSTGFFQNHPISDVLRSLFFSSILWMLLAIILYAVYSMVLGTR
jgi:hypothetical protein